MAFLMGKIYRYYKHIHISIHSFVNRKVIIVKYSTHNLFRIKYSTYKVPLLNPTQFGFYKALAIRVYGSGTCARPTIFGCVIENTCIQVQV